MYTHEDNYRAAQALYRSGWKSAITINTVLRCPIADLERRLSEDFPKNNSPFGQVPDLRNSLPPSMLRNQAIEVLETFGWSRSRIDAVLIDDPMREIWKNLQPPIQPIVTPPIEPLPIPKLPDLSNLSQSAIPPSTSSSPRANRTSNWLIGFVIAIVTVIVLHFIGISGWIGWIIAACIGIGLASRR
jgi:hypothetical protein